MEVFGLEIRCSGCERWFSVCEDCRAASQRKYCGELCQATARKASVDKAKRKYAQSDAGRESQRRRNRRHRIRHPQNRRLKKSETDHSTDQLNWDLNPKIPKQEILAFRNSAWIEEARNLVLIGDVGIAKSHVVKSLLYDAVLTGHTALFISVFDLISKIKNSPTPHKRIDYYGKNIRVLCLDELGYTYHSKEDTDLLFQIISKRSEALPTLVTTNLPPKKWGTIFSGMAASAMLDRLSYKGKFLTWEGKSGRTPDNL